MYEKITPENVVMYAIKHYDNPQCEGEKEFQDDMKRFKYIKRLLRKYYDTGVLKERLILNHLTVLNNVFGATACAVSRLLILSVFVSKDNLITLSPILVLTLLLSVSKLHI